jgi:hypothetical protein
MAIHPQPCKATAKVMRSGVSTMRVSTLARIAGGRNK